MPGGQQLRVGSHLRPSRFKTGQLEAREQSGNLNAGGRVASPAATVRVTEGQETRVLRGISRTHKVSASVATTEGQEPSFMSDGVRGGSDTSRTPGIKP